MIGRNGPLMYHFTLTARREQKTSPRNNHNQTSTHQPAPRTVDQRPIQLSTSLSIVDVLIKRVVRLSLLHRQSFQLHSQSFSLSSMFARAVQNHERTSSQNASLKQTSPTVQKKLEFGGLKRKALDVIDDSNKRTSPDRLLIDLKQKGVDLLQAVTRTDSFMEKKGQIVIDGEVFDEADFEDFDDIALDDWEVPASAQPVVTAKETVVPVKSNPVIVQEEDYFKDDDDDMDWDYPLPAANNVVATNKENTFPQPEAQAPPTTTEVAPPCSLGKVLFPSSQPLPWSSSPVDQSKPPPKRSLPWVTNPERYASDNPRYKSEKSKIKSIVRPQNSARGISTMAMEQPMDFEVLGLSQEAILAEQRTQRLAELRVKKEAAQRKEEEAKRKEEEAKRGMEWIDEAATTTRRRRQKTEEKPKLLKPGADKETIARVFLSHEQLSVRKMVVEDKKSVFFTGSAGIAHGDVDIRNWKIRVIA
jgi:hypothetical protein